MTLLYRCRSLEHLVAEYPCNPWAKILCLVAEIADFPSHGKMYQNGLLPAREVFAYCWSSQHVWPHSLVKEHSVRVSTLPRSGLATPRPRRQRAAGQFRCVAQDLRIDILHYRWPLLRCVWASGRSVAPTRHPHPCGGCCERIGATGVVKRCCYDSKFRYYRRGTRIMTVLANLGHPYVGQIEENHGAVDPK